MVRGGDTPSCAPATTVRRPQRRRHPLPASPRHAGGWCGRHGATRQRRNSDQRGRGHASLPGLTCGLPQVDALYPRKIARGAGGLPLYVGMGECIPRDGEACVGHLHVMDAGGMLRGWESMENLGMMPRQASPRPPWRVAPAWRGSSGFERCVHDADHSPEVCRLSPASPCSRLAFLPTKLHISSSSELSPRRASSSSARHISTSTCSAGTCAKSA
jgi:hypothetical protein